MKRVAVIGSTGSIGTSTLDVISRLQGSFEVFALAVGQNIDLLEQQVHAFSPQKICVWDVPQAACLGKRLPSLSQDVLSGQEGLLELVDDDAIDIYVFALSGTNGIFPLLKAIEKGKRIAIANKEPLVIAGGLIRKMAKQYGTEIIPVDSEHSALFQCLHGHNPAEVEKLIITASGGPFFSLPHEQFANITPAMALKHPKWNMGKKISIDSATMMNKVLEFLEAITLFGIGHDRIEIVIHPEAIIHSMVQFCDGSILAQMSLADMRIPIQYALTYPERRENSFNRIDFSALTALTFHVPDNAKFPVLDFGVFAAEKGGTLPAVLNAADEVCVEYFLKGQISFLEIPHIIGKVMRQHCVCNEPDYGEIMAADAWAREETKRLCLG